MGKIPIFIELRNVDFDHNISAHIANSLAPFTKDMSEAVVVAGLKAGVFALLLDGFDEIPLRHRKAADRQINRLAENYPNNIVIISSRPDDTRFISWQSFPVYQIAPLDVDKACGLISRIEFDQADKDLFISRIRNSLYDSHKAILSNPLLASMMLLTFKEFQDVPSKMQAFYGTAFDVLYRRHDTLKLDYRREFLTGLDLVDFKKVFMTFCFMSLIDGIVSFNRDRFIRYAEKAIKYEEFSINSENLLYDLEKNICIIHTEGEDINFIHRSFQEFFCATFLSKRSVENIYDFIDHIVTTVSTDVIEMLVEMDSEEYERKYFIEKLEKIDVRLSEAKTPRGKIEVISDHYIAVYFPDAEEAPGMFVPLCLKTAKHNASNNLPTIVTIANDRYNLPVFRFVQNNDGKWSVALEELVKGTRGFNVIRSKDLTIEKARLFGVIRYHGDLLRSVRSLRKSLEKTHNTKSRLLSDMLKRS